MGETLQAVCEDELGDGEKAVLEGLPAGVEIEFRRVGMRLLGGVGIHDCGGAWIWQMGTEM